ncbi:unnamed protein product [Periconia digitata]|uniref:Ribonuclease H1 N-terminal domain-containing protein n=1 Tax=Periconia digitata TaxID=1303443 RepID=A0A9W4XRB2_9PLEO|nr:unnamed protein product [Periconia digitata]
MDYSNIPGYMLQHLPPPPTYAIADSSTYPISMPQYPASMPQYPASMPQYPASMPQYPASMPQYPASMPQYPTHPTPPPQPRKYYAVVTGRVPGIYRDYHLANAQVDAFTRGGMKGFPNEEAAVQYMRVGGANGSTGGSGTPGSEDDEVTPLGTAVPPTMYGTPHPVEVNRGVPRGPSGDRSRDGDFYRPVPRGPSGWRESHDRPGPQGASGPHGFHNRPAPQQAYVPNTTIDFDEDFREFASTQGLSKRDFKEKRTMAISDTIIDYCLRGGVGVSQLRRDGKAQLTHAQVCSILKGICNHLGKKVGATIKDCVEEIKTKASFVNIIDLINACRKGNSPRTFSNWNEFRNHTRKPGNTFSLEHARDHPLLALLLQDLSGDRPSHQDPNIGRIIASLQDVEVKGEVRTVTSPGPQPTRQEVPLSTPPLTPSTDCSTSSSPITQQPFHDSAVNLESSSSAPSNAVRRQLPSPPSPHPHLPSQRPPPATQQPTSFSHRPTLSSQRPPPATQRPPRSSTLQITHTSRAPPIIIIIPTHLPLLQPTRHNLPLHNHLPRKRTVS